MIPVYLKRVARPPIALTSRLMAVLVILTLVALAITFFACRRPGNGATEDRKPVAIATSPLSEDPVERHNEAYRVSPARPPFST